MTAKIYQNFPSALPIHSRRRKPTLTNHRGSTVLAPPGREAGEGEGLPAARDRKAPYEENLRTPGKTGKTDKTPAKHIILPDKNSS